MRARWLGRVSSRLGLIAFGTGLGLGLAEVGTRVLGGGQASMTRGMFFVFDREAGKRCRPNADLRFVLPGSFDVRVNCNSQGLRDRERSLEKAPGCTRILLLGDSFAWGYGVENEEMVSTVLEEALSGGPQRPGGEGSAGAEGIPGGEVEVINFGVCGYSALQELARLESEGLAYSPDWVVVLFCENDLEGNFDDHESARPLVDLRGDGRLHFRNRPVRESWGAPATRWIHAHSRLVVEAYYALRLLEERAENRVTAARVLASSKEPGAPTAVADADHPAPRESALDASRGSSLASSAGSPPPGEARPPSRPRSLRSEDIRLSMIDLFVEPDERVDQAWTSLGQIYAVMRDHITAAGGRMLVAHVAEPAHVLPGWFEGAFEQAGVPVERGDPDRPAHRLEVLCEELGIAFVDVSPEFRRRPDPEQLFLRDNGHWNAAGHALAAGVLARRLRRLEPRFQD